MYRRIIRKSGHHRLLRWKRTNTRTQTPEHLHDRVNTGRQTVVGSEDDKMDAAFSPQHLDSL
jgi:hypothetical protein